MACLSREERRELVEWGNKELPIRTQAQLLGLNRSGLYYQPVPPSAEEVALKHRIDEIYTAHPYYGYRRIAAQLHRESLAINQKTVARYMQEMGLAAVYPGPQSLASVSTRRRFILTCWRTSQRRGRTISGASTSPTSACEAAGCTWSRSWIGTRAMW